MRLDVKKTETMGVSDDKSPITVKVGSDTLREVHSFKYLGARFNPEATCFEEVKTRLGLARWAASPHWSSRTLSNESKARLIQALIWPIVTYGAEAWTLNKELTGKIKAFEMQCYRSALRIAFTDHVSNAEVLDRMGQQRKLLGRIRERKMKYFGHVTRHSSLEKDVMLGPMPGLRRQGGQRRQ